jgi:hypothetical protein
LYPVFFVNVIFASGAVHEQLIVVVERFNFGEALAADDFALGHVQVAWLLFVKGRCLSAGKTNAGY